MILNLMQMSLQGSLMIGAVLLLRAVLGRRLPRATFWVLWLLVAVRLLVPFAIPLPIPASQPVVSAVEQAAETLPVPLVAPLGSPAAPTDEPTAAGPADPLAAETTAAPTTGAALPAVPLWPIAWAVGTVGCIAVFLWLRSHSLRALGPAGIARHTTARSWLACHPLRRPLEIRVCDGISSPITRGILHPVIMVPRDFDWSDRATATLVLEHEYVHARRFDAIVKFILAAALCVHWFNPLVWVMYFTANRDIEISCDERVARLLNTHGRKTYAHALVNAAADPLGFSPVISSFGAHPVTERVQAIACSRTSGLLATALSAALVALVGVVFAVVAVPVQTATGIVRLPVEEEPEAAVPHEETPSAYALDYVLPGTWFRCAQTLVMVPSYHTVIPHDLFSEGFTWEFYLDGHELAPAGTTEVLLVRDAATQEVRYLTYRYPLAEFAPEGVEGGPGTVDGYVVRTADLYDDYTHGAAIAIVPEWEPYIDGIEQEDGRWTTYLFLQEGGLRQYVLGFNSLQGTDLTHIAADAFCAHAEPRANGTDIVTSGYTVHVPADYVTNELNGTYRDTYSPELSGAYGAPITETRTLIVMLDQSKASQSFTVFCRTPGLDAPYHASDSVVVSTGQYTSDGLEIMVAHISYQEDGIDWEAARQKAELYASWISAS